MESEAFKNKIYVFLISSALTAAAVLLFFADASLEWGAAKAISCALVGLWVFFIPPALRKSYLIHRGEPLEYWFKRGLEFGAGGMLFPVLFAPVFGTMYYIERDRSN